MRRGSLNAREKWVLIALSCVFMLGIVFSVRDLNLRAINQDEFDAYNQGVEEVKNSIINLNSASGMQLELLKGIGSTKADAIIAYRQKNGPFKSVGDIMNVSGIGPATYDKIKDRLTLGEMATNQSKTSPSDSKEQGKIDINSCTQSELEKLSGIGPVKAKSIIEYREQIGSFRHCQDLLLVKGIGEKTLENLIPFITVSD